MWQSLNLLSWPETLFAGQNKPFSLYNHYTTAAVKQWLPESLLSLAPKRQLFLTNFPLWNPFFFSAITEFV